MVRNLTKQNVWKPHISVHRQNSTHNRLYEKNSSFRPNFGSKTKTTVRMKINIIALFLILSSMVIAAGSRQLRLKGDVTVDGKIQEWTNPLSYYDKDVGISYDLANDTQNLYLIFKVVDNTVQHQILSSGFELWINTKGKKKKTTGVLYPLPMSKPQDGDKTEAPAQRNMQQRPQGGTSANAPNGFGAPAGNLGDAGKESQQLFAQKTLTLSGFNIKNGLQPIEDCPVRTAVSLDKSGNLIYELAIPFSTFYKEQLEEKNKGVIFCIGLVVKKIDTPSSFESGSARTSGGGGQMGGGSGGGPGGGGPGGGGGQMGSMGGGDSMDGAPTGDNSADKTNATGEKHHWFKVTLAVK
jgi:uncharacterized membrane protein YgcG